MRFEWTSSTRTASPLQCCFRTARGGWVAVLTTSRSVRHPVSAMSGPRGQSRSSRNVCGSWPGPGCSTAPPGGAGAPLPSVRHTVEDPTDVAFGGADCTHYSGVVTVVFVTGMSGTGKSAALGELARRGHLVVDTDYGAYAED